MMLTTHYSPADLLRRWGALEPILHRIQNQHVSLIEQEALAVLVQLAEAEIERLKNLRPEDSYFQAPAEMRRVSGW